MPHEPISQIFRCPNGQWSAMRVVTFIVCLVVLGTWVTFCFIEGRFIPLDWPTVSVLGVSQAAKAIQGRFEFGPRGLNKPWEGEGGGHV